mmetsp:Transcript_2922/g.4960  ORF Transcript_2922/g.4960 Transcript_2922/m.4960 type:complete len:120 (+) Transcript_2922:658-1017(+)
MEEITLTKYHLNGFDRKPIDVKWERASGQLYAILYNRMLEVYNLTDETGEQGQEEACSTCVFEVLVQSFDFVGRSEIVVADVEGNLCLISGILSDETLTMKLIKTKFPRIRQVKSSFQP